MADDIPVVDISINIDAKTLKAFEELKKVIAELNKEISNLNKALAPLDALASRLERVHTNLTKLTQGHSLKQFRQELAELERAFCYSDCLAEFALNVKKLDKALDEFSDKMSVFYKEMQAYADAIHDFVNELKILDDLLNRVSKRFETYERKKARTKEGKEVEIAKKWTDKVMEAYAKFMEFNAKLTNATEKSKQSVESAFERVSKAIEKVTSKLNVFGTVFGRVMEDASTEAASAASEVNRLANAAERAFERISRAGSGFLATPSRLFSFMEKVFMVTRYSEHGYPDWLEPEKMKELKAFEGKLKNFPSKHPLVRILLFPFKETAKLLVYSVDQMAKLLGLDFELLSVERMIARLRERGVRATDEELRQMAKILRIREFTMNFFLQWTRNLGFLRKIRSVGAWSFGAVSRGGLLYPPLRTVGFTRFITTRVGEPVFWLLREFSELGENMTQIIQQFMGAFSFAVQYLRDRIIPRIEFMMRGLPPKLIELARKYSHIYGLPMEYILRSLENAYRRTKSIEATEYIFEQAWAGMYKTLSKSEKEMLAISGKVYKMSEIYQMTFIKEMLRLTTQWGGGDPTRAVEYLIEDIQSFAKLTAKMTMLIVMLFESIAPIVNAIANVIAVYSIFEMKLLSFIRGHQSLKDVKQYVDTILNNFISNVSSMGQSLTNAILRAIEATVFELEYFWPKVFGVLTGLFANISSSLIATISRVFESPMSVGDKVSKAVQAFIINVEKNFWDAFIQGFTAGLSPQKKAAAVLNLGNVIKGWIAAFKHGLIGAIYAAYKGLVAFVTDKNVMQRVLNTFLAAVSMASKFIEIAVKTLLETLASIGIMIVATLVKFIKAVVLHPKEVFGKFMAIVQTIGKAIAIIVISIVKGIIDALIDIVEGPLADLAKDVDDIIGALAKMFKPISDAINSAVQAIVEKGKEFIDYVVSIASTIADALTKGPFRALFLFFSSIANFLSKVGQSVTGFAKAIWDMITGAKPLSWETIVEEVMKPWKESAKSEAEKAKAELSNVTVPTFQADITSLTDYVNASANEIDEARKQVASTFSNIQKNVMRYASSTSTFVKTVGGALETVNGMLDQALKLTENATNNAQTTTVQIEVLSAQYQAEVQSALDELSKLFEIREKAKKATKKEELERMRGKVNELVSDLGTKLPLLAEALNELNQSINSILKKSGIAPFVGILPTLKVSVDDVKKAILSTATEVYSTIDEKLKKISEASKEASQGLDEFNDKIKDIKETLKFTILGGEYVPIPGNYGTLYPTEPGPGKAPISIYSVFTKAEQLFSSLTPFMVAKPVFKTEKVKTKEGKEVEKTELVSYTYAREIWNINSLTRFYNRLLESYSKSVNLLTSLEQGNVNAVMASLFKLEQSTSALMILSGASKTFGYQPGVKGFEQFKEISKEIYDLTKEAEQVGHEIFVEKLGRFLKKTKSYLEFFIAHAKEVDKLSYEGSLGYQSYRVFENYANALKDFGTFFNYMKNQLAEDLHNARVYLQSVFHLIDADVVISSYEKQAEEQISRVKERFKLDKYWISYSNLVANSVTDWVSKFTGYVATQVFSSFKNVWSAKFSVKQFGSELERAQWLQQAISSLEGMYYKLKMLFSYGFIDEGTFKELMAKLNTLMRKYSTELVSIILNNLDESLSELPADLSELFKSFNKDLSSVQPFLAQSKLFSAVRGLVLGPDAIENLNRLSSFISTLVSFEESISKLLQEKKIDERTAKSLLATAKKYLETSIELVKEQVEKAKDEVEAYKRYNEELARLNSIVVQGGIQNVSVPSSPFNVGSTMLSFVDWMVKNAERLRSATNAAAFEAVLNQAENSVLQMNEELRKLQTLGLLTQSQRITGIATAIDFLMNTSTVFAKFKDFLNSFQVDMYTAVDAFHAFERYLRQLMNEGDATFQTATLGITTITKSLDGLWTAIDNLEKVFEKEHFYSIGKLDEAKNKVDELRHELNVKLAPYFAQLYTAYVQALTDALSSTQITQILTNPPKPDITLIQRKVQRDVATSTYANIFGMYGSAYTTLMSAPTSITDALSMVASSSISSLLGVLSEVSVAQANQLKTKVETFREKVQPFYEHLLASINAELLSTVIDVLSKEKFKRIVSEKLTKLKDAVKKSIEEGLMKQLDQQLWNAIASSYSLSVYSFKVPSPEQILQSPISSIGNIVSTLGNLVQAGLISIDEAKRILDEYQASYSSLIEAENNAALQMIRTLSDANNTVTSMLGSLGLEQMKIRTAGFSFQTTVQSMRLPFQVQSQLASGATFADVALTLLQRREQLTAKLVQLRTQMLTLENELNSINGEIAKLSSKTDEASRKQLAVLKRRKQTIEQMLNLYKEQEAVARNALSQVESAQREIAKYADVTIEALNADAKRFISIAKQMAMFTDAVGDFSKYVDKEISTWSSLRPSGVESILQGVELFIGGAERYYELVAKGRKTDAEKAKRFMSAIFGEGITDLVTKSANAVRIASIKMKAYAQIVSEPIKKFYEWVALNAIDASSTLLTNLAHRMRLGTEVAIEKMKTELSNIDYSKLEQTAVSTAKRTALASAYATNMNIEMAQALPKLFGVDEQGKLVTTSQMYSKTMVNTVKVSKNLTLTMEAFTDVSNFANKTISGLISSLSKLATMDFSQLSNFIDSLFELSYLLSGLGIATPEQISQLTGGLIAPTYSKTGQLLGFQFNAEPIVSQLQPIIASIASYLMQSIKVLEPFFQAIVSALVNVFSTIASLAMTFAGTIASIVMPILAPLMAVAGPFLIIVGAMVVLVPIVDALAKGLGIATNGMDKFLGSIMGLLGSIVQLGMALLKVVIAPIAQALNLLGYVVAPIIDVLAQFIDFLAKFIEPIAEFSSELFNAIAPVFKALGDALSAFLAVALGIVEAIMNVIGAVVNFFKPVVDFIINVLNFIAKIVAGFIEFIAGLFHIILSFLEAIGLYHESGGASTSEPSVVNVNINMENVQLSSPEDASELGESLGYTIKRKWKTA